MHGDHFLESFEHRLRGCFRVPAHAVTSAVSGSETALIEALGVTLAWAWTPFAMSLAWLTRTKRILGVATAIFTILSPLIAAWVFSWAWQDAVTGFIPTVVIVAMGFRLPEKKGAGFAPLAGVVAAVSVGWLMLGAVISLAVPLYNAAGSGWMPASIWAGSSDFCWLLILYKSSAVRCGCWLGGATAGVDRDRASAFSLLGEISSMPPACLQVLRPGLCGRRCSRRPKR